MPSFGGQSMYILHKKATDLITELKQLPHSHLPIGHL